MRELERQYLLMALKDSVVFITKKLEEVSCITISSSSCAVVVVFFNKVRVHRARVHRARVHRACVHRACVLVAIERRMS